MIKRKILSTLLAITGLLIIGFAILFSLDFLKEQEAGVLIESEPISKVFIDGVEVGNTPYEANRHSGEINLKIKPENDQNNSLGYYVTKVNLVPGVRTIVKRVFKNDEDASSGVVVSFEKIGGIDSFVTVVSTPDNAQIFIDNKAYGFTPLRVNLEAGDHNLSVKTDGYLEKLLPIRVYKGYNLTASVKLGRSGELAVPVAVKPQEMILERIRINKTNTGFLRVRSGANIGFPEVAQVKPGEEYDVFEEGEHGKWFKIKVGDIDGWVASEFVTKI